MPKTKTPHLKTDVKQVREMARKRLPAEPVVQFADPLTLFADPAAIQRAMADPRALSSNAIPGLQHAFGNQFIQRMIADTVQRQPDMGALGEVKELTGANLPGKIPTPKEATKAASEGKLPGNQPSLPQPPRGDVTGGAELPDALSTQIERETERGGSPPPPDLQAKMRQNLGIAEPEQIQVHTDASADALSKQLGARAFTAGEHIFVQEGEYNPGSTEGERLLMHEGWHTVQQGASKRKATQTKMSVSSADDKYEQEAEEVAGQAVEAPEPRAPLEKDEKEPSLGTARPRIHRKEDEEEISEEQEKEAKKEEKNAEQKQEDTRKSAKEKDEQKEQKEAQEKKKLKAAGEQKQGEQKPSAPAAEALAVAPGELESMKFDPETIEEPEVESTPLPTWEELAAGTVQPQLSDTYYEERFWVTSGGADISVGTEGGGGEGSEGTTEPEPVAAGAVDKGQLIGEALGQGVVEGLTEGLTSFIADQAVEAATAKIPYADGLINLVQMAYDPKKWASENVLAVGEGAVEVGRSFMAMFEEDNAFGGIAAFLEFLISIIDFVNSIVGLVNQILTILLFVSKLMVGVGSALVAIPWPGPWWSVGYFLISFFNTVIGIFEPVNNLLGAIGTILGIFKTLLTFVAMMFRLFDIMYSKADPEMMMAKQEKLKGHVSGFTSATTTRLANRAKNKASKALSRRADLKKIKQAEAEQRAFEQGAGPPPKKSPDELKADFEKTHGRTVSEEGGKLKSHRKGKKWRKPKYVLKKAATYTFLGGGSIKKQWQAAKGAYGEFKTNNPRIGSRLAGLEAQRAEKKHQDRQSKARAAMQDTQNLPEGHPKKREAQKLQADAEAAGEKANQKRQEQADLIASIEPKKKAWAGVGRREEYAEEKRKRGEAKGTEEQATNRMAEASDDERNAGNLRTRAQGQEEQAQGLRKDADKDVANARDLRSSARDNDGQADNLLSGARDDTRRAGDLKRSARKDRRKADDLMQEAGKDQTQVLALKQQARDLDRRKQPDQAQAKREEANALDLRAKQNREQAEELDGLVKQQDQEAKKLNQAASEKRKQARALEDQAEQKRQDARSLGQAAIQKRKEAAELDIAALEDRHNAQGLDRSARRKRDEAGELAETAKQKRKEAGPSPTEKLKKEIDIHGLKDWRSWVGSKGGSGGQRHGPGVTGPGGAFFFGTILEEFTGISLTDVTTFLPPMFIQDFQAELDRAIAKRQQAAELRSRFTDDPPPDITPLYAEVTYIEDENDPDYPFKFTQARENLSGQGTWEDSAQRHRHDGLLWSADQVIERARSMFQKAQGKTREELWVERYGEAGRLGLLNVSIDGLPSFPMSWKVSGEDGFGKIRWYVTNGGGETEQRERQIEGSGQIPAATGEYTLELKRSVQLTVKGSDGSEHEVTYEMVDATTDESSVSATYRPTVPAIIDAIDDMRVEKGKTQQVSFKTYPFTGGVQVSARSSNQQLVNLQLGSPYEDAGIAGAGPYVTRVLRIEPVSRTAGEATITITASDADRSAESSFQVEFFNRPPAFEPASPFTDTAYVDTQYNRTIHAYDYDDSDLTITTRPPTPDWLGLELTESAPLTLLGQTLPGQPKVSKEVALSGEPSSNDAGENTVLVEANDGEESTQLSFTVTVNPLQQCPANADPASPARTTSGRIIQRQADEEPAEEIEVEEEPEAEAEATEEGAGPSLEEHRYTRTMEIIESLPEMPEGAEERLTGLALAQDHLDIEEYDLLLQQEQVAGLTIDAESQRMEVQGTRAVTQANQQQVAVHQADVEQRYETQSEVKNKSAGEQGQANEGAEKGNTGMEMLKSIFSKIMAGFGLAKSEGAAEGDPNQADKMKQGAGEQAKGGNQAADATQQTTALSGQWMAQTAKTKGEAQQSQGELQGLDDTLADEEQGTTQGIGELEGAQALTEENVLGIQDEKQRMRDEHEATVQELNDWADEHQSTRTSMFEELEAELAAMQEEEAEAAEAEAEEEEASTEEEEEAELEVV